LKIRAFDPLGSALGATNATPVCAIRAQVEEFGGHPLCTLIGGGSTAPGRAALYNGALIRYLDFNDSYLAPVETCHPSDNLAPGTGCGRVCARFGTRVPDRTSGRPPGASPAARPDGYRAELFFE
jgi:hypothetical protein